MTRKEYRRIESELLDQQEKHMDEVVTKNGNVEAYIDGLGSKALVPVIPLVKGKDRVIVYAWSEVHRKMYSRIMTAMYGDLYPR